MNAEFKISRKGEENRQLRVLMHALSFLGDSVETGGWKYESRESFKRMSFSPLLHQFSPAPLCSTANVNKKVRVFSLVWQPKYIRSANIMCPLPARGIRSYGIILSYKSFPISWMRKHRMSAGWVLNLELREFMLRWLDDRSMFHPLRTLGSLVRKKFSVKFT